MFTSKPSDEKSRLDDAIDHLFDDMAHVGHASNEYAKMVTQLAALYKLKELNNPKRVSPDTLAIVIGNLVGIMLIVGHERIHVLTSKATNFVLKLQ